MQLSIYLNPLLKHFTDSRIVRNINQMVRKIIENQSIRLWSNASDKAEFDRCKRLIDGSLKSVLDDEKMTEALRENSVNALGSHDRLILLHAPCDIRKEQSKTLEKLGRVRALDNKPINGYQTFNTVAIDEKGKNVCPVDMSIYSNGDEHYVTQAERKQFQKGQMKHSDNEALRLRGQEIERFLEEESDLNLKKVTEMQLSQVSQAFKKDNESIRLCHVLDRQFDGLNTFQFIDAELDDELVIRLKISRNSNQSSKDEQTHQQQWVKLKSVHFAHGDSFLIEKLVILKNVYQQATCLIEWDLLTLDEKSYAVVRITLSDRTGKPIYDHPMLLLTNISVRTPEQRRSIYRIYLHRSKIEGVFKFLKSVLGWEEFQVRDYESIKNIIALCYFVGGYFYEIESELTKNPVIQQIARLGGSKAQITRYHFLQGLAKILTYQSVVQFVQTQQVTDEGFEEMVAFIS